MAVVLTEADTGNMGDTEAQRVRAMLASMLFRAQTLGARVVDLDRYRDPVLIAWSETEILEWPADPPSHLVPTLLPFFVRSGLTELSRLPEGHSAPDPLRDILITRCRDGEADWKFWCDNSSRLQFIRTTPLGPIEKLVAWGSKGERCCNIVVLKNEVEDWANAMQRERAQWT